MWATLIDSKPGQRPAKYESPDKALCRQVSNIRTPEGIKVSYFFT